MTKELRNKIAHLVFDKDEKCKYCLYANECDDFIEDCKSFQPISPKTLDMFED